MMVEIGRRERKALNRARTWALEGMTANVAACQQKSRHGQGQRTGQPAILVVTSEEKPALILLEWMQNTEEMAIQGNLSVG